MRTTCIMGTSARERDMSKIEALTADYTTNVAIIRSAFEAAGAKPCNKIAAAMTAEDKRGVELMQAMHAAKAGLAKEFLCRLAEIVLDARDTQLAWIDGAHPQFAVEAADRIVANSDVFMELRRFVERDFPIRPL